MFTATEFFYDGICSAKYGLKIASLNNSVTEETAYLTPNIAVSKSQKSNKFHYLNITYDSPPTFNFSVASESPIHNSSLREILNWLDARHSFKPFVVMQQGYQDLTYYCIFSVTEIIYHAGNVVGFNLSATFNSNYVEGPPIEHIVFSNGEEKIIELFNDSDNIEEYIYPVVEFDTTDGKISITNLTDDETREFLFENLNANTRYIVDNELKIIEGDGNNLLSKFSKKWLRILRGKNKIRVRVNGVATIRCPRYIKISF